MEGLHHLTAYGKLILSLLPGLGFVSENRAYFLEHDVSVLPVEFIERIGELSRCTFQGDTISNFAYEEGMFREADEYCWAVAD